MVMAFANQRRRGEGLAKRRYVRFPAFPLGRLPVGSHKLHVAPRKGPRAFLKSKGCVVGSELSAPGRTITNQDRYLLSGKEREIVMDGWLQHEGVPRKNITNPVFFLSFFCRLQGMMGCRRMSAQKFADPFKSEGDVGEAP